MASDRGAPAGIPMMLDDADVERLVGERASGLQAAAGRVGAGVRRLVARRPPFLRSAAGAAYAGGGGRAREDTPTREVWIGEQRGGRNAGFPTNYVSTTKYSPLNAVPKFLVEQFTRFSNAYFLLVGILYCIDDISPVVASGRYAGLGVLSVVVAISGVKEAIEDGRRYKQDRSVNRARTEILGGKGGAGGDRWDSVNVGDIVKVRSGETFPADLLLLSSASEDGLAYVETKQLDGESNLKVKVAARALASAFSSEEAAMAVRGKVQCEAPNDRLYKFHGAVTIDSVAEGVAEGREDAALSSGELREMDAPTVPVGPENLMIRGSSLRNTAFVLGLVINTGRDTKLMQNVKPRPRKNSRLERTSSRELYVTGFAWYLFDRESCSAGASALKFFTFFATFSGLIPISLYVTMEIVRGWQVYFIGRDIHIMDHVNGVKTEVRTSNLNEELGVVRYVFTDKTGTLTANQMIFKKASLGGRVYSSTPADEMPENGATRLQELCDAIQSGAAADVASSSAATFTPHEVNTGEMGLRLLAICHSVVAEAPRPAGSAAASSDASDVEGDSDLALKLDRRETGDVGTGETPDITYQASSPDEAALVAAARAHGFKFISRSNRLLTIEVNGELEEYELMEILEFDSTRKRMSVIVRGPDGRIKVFTKGADCVIFERLAPDQDPNLTTEHLHDFAVEGLRTLCLAYADLDESFYQKWKLRYMQASSQMENRDEAVAAVAEEVETGLTLIGATAIEDKLQDDVPETLRMLEQASVKIWVLTGDKQETAINIGLSCGAIEDGMDVYIINEDNVEDTAAQMDCAIGRWKALLHDPGMERKLGLVIDGQTLHHALTPELQKKLMHLGRMARSVIACRVSPKQKTELVELVRRHEKDKVTLAIGDGANDVGMIQAAHVGVGIVGVEGQEAKLASDYSIGQFRFLQRLMLVHGRWSYKRLSKMVLYTIYKTMALTMCELYWATSTAFTGQPLLDPWLTGVYNLFSASLPPLILGILDQELSADYALSFPEIYVKGQRNTAFNLSVFLHWIATAVWHSALVFYMTAWGVGDQAQGNGQHLGMWSFGTIVFTLVTIVVHSFAVLYQSAWTRLTVGLYLISIFAWFLIGPLFSIEAISLNTDLSPNLFGVTHRILSDARVWFLIFVVPVMCVTPSLLWKFWKRQQKPNLKMLVQELIRSGLTREDVTSDFVSKPLRRLPSYDPEASGLTGPVGPATFVKDEQQYTFSGFNFDGDEGVSLLVRRHAYANSKGLRRRRMRILKRAGSDTELDVAGVITEQVPSPATSLDNATFEPGTHPPAHHRRRGPSVAIPSEFLAADSPGGATHPPPPSDRPGRNRVRRAMSDGAVFVEDRYDRAADLDDSNVDVMSPQSGRTADQSDGGK